MTWTNAGLSHSSLGFVSFLKPEVNIDLTDGCLCQSRVLKLMPRVSAVFLCVSCVRAASVLCCLSVSESDAQHRDFMVHSIALKCCTGLLTKVVENGTVFFSYFFFVNEYMFCFTAAFL